MSEIDVKGWIVFRKPKRAKRWMPCEYDNETGCFSSWAKRQTIFYTEPKMRRAIRGDKYWYGAYKYQYRIEEIKRAKL